MLVHVSTPLPFVPDGPAVLRLPPAVGTMPTDRALAALKAIDAYRRTTGAPPTVRDVAEALGVQPQAVVQHFDALERKGYIRRRRQVARGVSLTPLGELLADGWTFGPSDGLDPRALAIDTNMARYMRCGCCNQRGLTFIVMHNGAEYGGVYRCPRDGWQEGA